MERKPFPVRYSVEEMKRLKMEAKVVGWPVGQLIRFRSLRGDLETEKLLAAGAKAMKSMTQDKERN